jgi:integrase
VWSEEAEEALLAVADEPMQRAFKLMLYTGQRQQDALKLEWTKYVDGRLSVRQRKTWPLIDIPAAANLKVLLNSLPRMSTHVLTDALGRPWTQRAFGS